MASRHRWLFVLLVIVVLGGVVPPPRAVSQDAPPYPNVLANGGFESGAASWFADTGRDGRFEATTEGPRTGQRAGAIFGDPYGRAAIVQIVPFSPDAEYRLSGYVLNRDRAYDSVDLTLQFRTPTERPSVSTRADPNEEWERFETEWMTPPQGATQLRVTIVASSQNAEPSGPVLLDDFTVHEKRTATPTPEPTAEPTSVPTAVPTSTPSPLPTGEATAAPTVTPTVMPAGTLSINEVLTSPQTVDWNGDGTVDTGDEWIELYLEGGSEQDLAGWSLDDGPDGSKPYQIRPDEAAYIYPGKYVAFLSSQTGLQLNDAGDTVRLFRPDGTLADEVAVPALKPDRSLARYPDGGKERSAEYVPTLAGKNGSRGKAPDPSPSPSPDPRSATVAEARAAKEGELLRVEGSVSAPPHLVGANRMYIQDGAAGVLVVVPETVKGYALGDVVAVTGAADTFFGERSLRAQDGGVERLRTGAEPKPRQARTGDVGPKTEGMLVRLAGTVASVGKPAIQLDDGSGEARVLVADSTGIAWPDPSKEDALDVVGVVSSHNKSFRLLPRYGKDLVLTPKPPPAPRSVTAREARTASDGELLQLEAVITAPPGPLGATHAYAQDSTGGILVTGVPAGRGEREKGKGETTYPSAFPPSPFLSSGDRVRLVGEAGAAFGERLLRLRPADGVRRLGSGQPPRPTRIAGSAVGPDTEGLLVEVEGVVSESAWPSIYLEGKARVYALDSAGLSNPAARRGDTLKAVGIVDSHQGANRLLPYEPSHLAITKRAEPDPTPSPSPRPSPPDPPYERATVAQARSAPPGARLLVEGSVTAPPGLFDERQLYVQDATGGVLVTGVLPPAALGDVVEVRGVAGTFHGERRLAADAVRSVRSGAPIAPRPIGTGEVGSSTEGQLVAIEGVVNASGWPSLYIGDPEVRVYARPLAGIPNPGARRGDSAKAVGIVSSWDGGFRVLPRSAADLALTRAPEPSPSPSPGPSPDPSPSPGPEYRDVALAEARALPEGTRVRVEAQVTAPPGLLGEARTYIGTADAGLALHLVGGGYPALAEGDRVRAQGTLDTYFGEVILRLESASDVERLGVGDPLPPAQLETGSLASAEGRLVTLKGTITQRQWPSLLFDDGSGEARLLVSPSTGIPVLEGGKGDAVQVTGVVSRRLDLFRVLPRSAADLRITPAPSPSPSPSPSASPQPGPEYRDVTLLEARALPEGTRVRFEASITAPPGVLGEHRAYVGTPDAGLALHLAPGGYPELLLGDRVAAKGEIDRYHGELILRLGAAADVERLGAGDPPPPIRISTGGVGASAEGRLASIRGTITRRQWPTLYVDDGSGETRIRVMESTEIPAVEGGKGDAVAATGLVSQWDGGYRVLPRSEGDLRVSLAPKPSPSPSPSSSPEPEYRDVALSEVRGLPLGALVRFEARVTARPGVLGEPRAYVGTSDAGLALHLVGGAYPALREGDRVRAQGELDTYYGELILRLHAPSHVARLGGGDPPPPMRLETGEVGAAAEGRLVRLDGPITRRQWPSLWLDDGSGEGRVRVMDATGIPRIEGGAGDSAVVTGVVSQWLGGYRVLPRAEADLEITPAPEEEPQPAPELCRGTAPPCPYRDVSLAQVRSLPLGARVRFGAQVTARPGVLGESRTYVGAPDAGLALHLPGGGYPALGEGDRVRAQGTLDTYYGELILRIEAPSDVARLGAGAPLPATALQTGAVSGASEGRLVRVRAAITQRQWPTLFLDDGSGETRMRVMDSTGIPRLDGGKGDSAAVEGVISQWNGRFRLLPRERSDIAITLAPKGADDGSDTGERTEGYREVQLSQLRSLPLGTRVSFGAQVTAAPGVLGEARTYVGTTSAGVALHLPGGGYPALGEGDRVRVRGELDTYYGELIVRLEEGADVYRLGPGAPLRAFGTSTRGVGRLTEGRLVSVEALITQRQWPTLSVDDGSGEGRVRVLDSTGIPRLDGGKGDHIRATGIVSQWNGRWRLLPRRAQDLGISVLPSLPTTGGGGSGGGIPTPSFLGLAVLRGGRVCVR